jgi:hypothetical protein
MYRRDLFEAGRERTVENPGGDLQPAVEIIPSETGVSLPHDMGIGPNMGINDTAFG